MTHARTRALLAAALAVASATDARIAAAEPAMVRYSVRIAPAAVRPALPSEVRLHLSPAPGKRVDASGAGAMVALFESRAEKADTPASGPHTYEVALEVVDENSGASHVFTFGGATGVVTQGSPAWMRHTTGPAVSAAVIGERYYRVVLLGPGDVAVPDDGYFRVHGVLIRSWPETVPGSSSESP